jgi:hypothetical protein
MSEATSRGSHLMKTSETPSGPAPRNGGSSPTLPLQFNKATDTPLWLEEIELRVAAEFVLNHHYSKVMPKQTKLVLGAFKGKGGLLVGVITFGWGVRPQDTLRALFPSLDTGPGFAKQYLEIGKMCVHNSEPKNTESRLLSLAARYVKKHRPEVKLIFTWADALWGKPGYVYQAANYYYGGFIWTDVYTDKGGIRLHPRQLPRYVREMLLKRGHTEEQIKNILQSEWRADNGIGVKRPSKEMMVKYGLKHVFGMQFRYVFFLCDKEEEQRLLKDSATARTITYETTISRKEGKTVEKKLKIATVKKKEIKWARGPYPKATSMEWKEDDGKHKDGKPSKPIKCSQPKFGEAFDPNRL